MLTLPPDNLRGKGQLTHFQCFQTLIPKLRMCYNLTEVLSAWKGKRGVCWQWMIHAPSLPLTSVFQDRHYRWRHCILVAFRSEVFGVWSNALGSQKKGKYRSVLRGDILYLSRLRLQIVPFPLQHRQRHFSRKFISNNSLIWGYPRDMISSGLYVLFSSTNGGS